jgi:hypothetical protein
VAAPARQDHVAELSKPDIRGIATEAIFAFSNEQLDINNFDEPWPQLAFQHNPVANSSTGGHLMRPSIRVTDSNNTPAQPQTDFTNLYQQQQAQQLHLNTALSDFGAPYNYLAQERSPIQSPGNMHEHTPSIHSPSNLRSPSNLDTPVSLVGTRSSPGNDRSRRPSTASSSGRIGNPSEDDLSQDGGNERSPRRPQAHKRLEEPPRDSSGKMTCKYADCSGVTFDRKCEWR